jgi:alpha-D-xyloside xylohydrolase
VNVYTGADGNFSLYEDDGVSRQYLNGKHSRIPLVWSEVRKTLTVGAREGSYSGMAGKRVIKIRWIRPGRPLNLDAADTTVTYRGAPLVVRMR